MKKQLSPKEVERISEISSRLLVMDQQIANITGMSYAPETPDPNVLVKIGVFQERTTKPELLENMMLPPIQLGNNMNPAQAAAYLRQVIESDRAAIARQEIPDFIEVENMVTLDIGQGIVFKVLAVLRDAFKEEKDSLNAELCKIFDDGI